jgi:hypothetical protein
VGTGARRDFGQAAQWAAVSAGERAYLSASLAGADWWVAGPIAARAEDAQVELDEVGRFITDHDIWNRLA